MTRWWNWLEANNAAEAVDKFIEKFDASAKTAANWQL